ncbi:unnamed protein product [Zymoseptoria tritici ST99CH_1A5]|uniref:SprT-like domain-containing protein n=1 Tax=Zymoseptoria tritici ST99CH_1A5 TaxID=1276529 RepID=A0A1Y6L7Y0_ZYMTR|nr:unnamed protein product [Zymoseptoria tritici ST99CH_1A5]
MSDKFYVVMDNQTQHEILHGEAKFIQGLHAISLEPELRISALPSFAPSSDPSIERSFTQSFKSVNLVRFRLRFSWFRTSPTQCNLRELPYHVLDTNNCRMNVVVGLSTVAAISKGGPEEIRKAWPSIRKTKVLEPTLVWELPKPARETGTTWKLDHDKNITQATIKWINEEKWDQQRQDAWGLLKGKHMRLLYEAAENGTIGTLDQTTGGYYLSVMQQFIQGLDGVFFNNQLAPYCKFRFYEDIGEELEAYAELIEGNFVMIKVKLSAMENVSDIRNAVLHELCHAVQLLLGCDSAHGCRTCLTEAEFIGPIEHPECFLDLSMHVENLATTLLGEQVDLGRKAAIDSFDDVINDAGETYPHHATHHFTMMHWRETLQKTNAPGRVVWGVQPLSALRGGSMARGAELDSEKKAAEEKESKKK